MSNQVSDVASTSVAADEEDSDSDHASSKSKTVHSMVEKKRRDKMAQYVSELSNMIPMCGVMQRKLDKITVLRMAVQHLKAIKGSKVSPSNDVLSHTPLASEGMMKAVLESTDCFLFVIACDRGKFLYVSESVSNFINCSHTELIGQSIFDVLHSKDIAKVKEQLVASDVTAREVFIDAKTMEPVNPGVVPKEELNIASPGAARMFFCRMKNRLQPELVLKTEPDVTKKRTAHTYVNLHCTGFLKTWASSKVTMEAGLTDPSEVSCNLACLVAVARISPRLTQSHLDSVGHVNMKPVQFYTRLNCDHQFSFVEPMVTYVTGFLPQEVLGSLVFELFMEEDVSQIKELLRMCTKTNEKLVSSIMNIRTVDHSPIYVRVVVSAFHNPLTSDLEHILLDITAVASYTKSTVSPISTRCAEGGSRERTDSKYAISQSTHTGSNISDPLISGSDGDDDMNNEASKAIIMSLLEADGGLGGPIAGQNLSWLLTKTSYDK